MSRLATLLTSKLSTFQIQSDLIYALETADNILKAKCEQAYVECSLPQIELLNTAKTNSFDRPTAIKKRSLKRQILVRMPS